MGETEMPPPALPGSVSHLLLWASHSFVCVCVYTNPYHCVYHKAVREGITEGLRWRQGEESGYLGSNSNSTPYVLYNLEQVT